MDTNEPDSQETMPRNKARIFSLAIGPIATIYLLSIISHNVITGYHVWEYLGHYLALTLLSPFMYYFWSFIFKTITDIYHPNWLVLTKSVFKGLSLLIGFFASVYGYLLIPMAAMAGRHVVGPAIALIMLAPALPFIIYFHIFVLEKILSSDKLKEKNEGQMNTCNMCRNEAIDGELFCADHFCYSPNYKKNV